LIVIVESVAYARAGLAGNPSDGYFGKCLAVIVKDFSARVWLEPADTIEIVPSPEDRPAYASLEDFMHEIQLHGFYGAERLMKAAIRRFVRYCREHNHPLHDKGFRLNYRSTIPRRVGLSGSSGLITATLRCLMKFYGVSIDNPVLATLIRNVENEDLGIGAGLMDRVMQVYEGCVFMDLNREHIEKHGYGVYEEIDVKLLPPLYIAYRTDLAEGSEVFHNNIKERFFRGDPDVVQAMKDFGEIAQTVRDLIVAGRGREIGPWMDKNFDRRRSIFNLSKGDIEMVERARTTGASAKFAGSGGAIVGTYPDEATYDRLVKVFAGTGTEVFKPTIA